jgi:hypothetical protein
MRRDFVLRRHWLYVEYAACVATSFSGRIASTIHLD